MKTTAKVIVTALALTLACAAGAEIRTETVEYTQDDTTLVGFVAWDDAAEGKRPGVLVVHEWWGHNEHARNQARRLAEAGYVGFALDLYGDGRNTSHPEEAQAFAREATSDIRTLGARFYSALERLKQVPQVDPERVAAIGYCFGGGVVLGMARAGADLDAVVSFHGPLASEAPAETGQVRARILVLTGEDDPMVPAEDVDAFEEEMREAGAAFQVVSYPGARHGFTNPEAGDRGMEALAYDAEADSKSWQAMLELFAETFASP